MKSNQMLKEWQLLFNGSGLLILDTQPVRLFRQAYRRFSAVLS